MRAMEKGAVEYFPLCQYNTVRASKGSTLVVDRLEGGMDWDITLDRDNKRVKVTRIA